MDKTVQTPPTGAVPQIIKWRAYAYPGISWFNYFPYAFEKKKAKQLQDLINSCEAEGNTVLEILQSPFIRFILVGGEN